MFRKFSVDYGSPLALFFSYSGPFGTHSFIIKVSLYPGPRGLCACKLGAFMVSMVSKGLRLAPGARIAAGVTQQVSQALFPQLPSYHLAPLPPAPGDRLSGCAHLTGENAELGAGRERQEDPQLMRGRAGAWTPVCWIQKPLLRTL